MNLQTSRSNEMLSEINYTINHLKFIIIITRKAGCQVLAKIRGESHTNVHSIGLKSQLKLMCKSVQP